MSKAITICWATDQTPYFINSGSLHLLALEADVLPQTLSLLSSITVTTQSSGKKKKNKDKIVWKLWCQIHIVHKWTNCGDEGKYILCLYDHPWVQWTQIPLKNHQNSPNSPYVNMRTSLKAVEFCRMSVTRLWCYEITNWSCFEMKQDWYGKDVTYSFCHGQNNTF